tara:strand:- start:152 stop:1582 length:1431 start_codon:yes stop_codon:yes gene_type:complete
MIFNSIEFFIFLPLVFMVYWLIPSSQYRKQNVVILLASYVFYGWWDWRFLSLIMLSSALDYGIGIALAKKQDKRQRKYLLALSCLVNIGLLAYFKYYNFFLDSFIDAFRFFGNQIEFDRLKVILPVGISFYTFQTLSYSIDVYKRKIEPSKDAVSFFAFVSFFPQLVAGPIERASNLLPQFNVKRKFDLSASVDGMRQILWGFFKKIVIADNCAVLVNDIFAHHQDYSGSTLAIGAILFAFQIYGDFSGYSDIAIGTARLFGFQLMKNFAFPYFSRDIAEFWRRWHISLSTWFRDYVYIPLGGSRLSKSKTVRNTMIIFLVSGFWHGANWTFVFWGFFHALLFMPLLLTAKNRNHIKEVESSIPSFRMVLSILRTFLLVSLAWVFFRAEHVSDALYIIRKIFTDIWQPISIDMPMFLWPMIFAFLLWEWIHRTKEHGLQFAVFKKSRGLRWLIYYSIILAIVLLGNHSESFIYFQF